MSSMNEGASMKRTTVMLSADLRRRAFRRAKEQGVSFGVVVRDSLNAALPTLDEAGGDDSLFIDVAVWRGRAPRGLAREHDRYLYDSEP
jgi:type II secretory pathway component PulJ